MAQVATIETDKGADVAEGIAGNVVELSKGTIDKAPTIADAATGAIAIYLHNMETFARVQKALIEGNRALVGQQLDVIKSTVQQFAKDTQKILAERDLKSNLRLRFEVAKASMQEGIGNSNMLSETSVRSNAQAAQIIQSRTFEVLDEWEAALEKMLTAGWAFPGR
jgi:phasin family protein